MIKSFRHKGLSEPHEKGASRRVPSDLVKRSLRVLSAIDAATSLGDLSGPGLSCHPLRGSGRQRYAVSVNGPWRITFEWSAPNALLLDLEQYH